MTVRYLIAGANGMLGTALQRMLSERGESYEAPPESEFDITDEAAVARVVQRFAAAGDDGVLINAAAYTNVERAEDEPDIAHRVNELGARILATAACDNGLRFAHVSTDFVFDGTKGEPYVETDEPNPLSVYGASKLAGDMAVAESHPEAMIARTAWVYGPPGPNFPTKILERARSHGELQIVDNELGCPTYTRDLALGILGLLAAGAEGLYHLAGTGSCSRFEMALKTIEFAGLATRVEPVDGSQFHMKAARPKDGRLDCSKARVLGVELPPWQSSLQDYVSELERQ